MLKKVYLLDVITKVKMIHKFEFYFEFSEIKVGFVNELLDC